MSKIDPPKASFVYLCVSYLFVFPIFRFFLRGRILGKENVPKSGPLVVVANHGSHIDPPLLGHALGRPIMFMAKAELFRIPLLSKIIKMCGAYPVKRGSSDREAIRTATFLLNQGWATGLFLDGKRQSNGRINRPMAGAALIAARSQSYLLPVAIINSHRVLQSGSIWPRLLPIHLRIGEPIPPPENTQKINLEATTNALKLVINSLLDKGLLPDN